MDTTHRAHLGNLDMSMTHRVHLGSLDMGSVPPMRSIWSSPSQPSLRLTPVHSQTHTWVLKSSQKILSCQLSPVPPSAEALSCILGRQDWMYGRIGKRTKTQFCIPLHSSCLPLESSQRRQRHPIATPLKDTKGRTPTTEQFFCIFLCGFWVSVRERRRPGKRAASFSARRRATTEDFFLMLMLMNNLCSFFIFFFW